MLCGYLKQTCKSITVQQLIDILKLCKNPDAIIKMNDMTNFYIHFDIDGQFINLTKSVCVSEYGECGTDNMCSKCTRHDNAKNICKCDGKDCINASSIVDTEKFNELSSSEIAVQEDSRSQSSTKQFENDKYNLDNFSINGSSDSNNKPTKEDISTLEYIVEKEDTKKTPLDEKYLESIINSAISKALEKMINSLKG